MNLAAALVFLTLTVWLAHFLLFLQFGLYEDDYYFISGAWRTLDFLQQMRIALTEMPTGRPLGMSVPHVVAFIGFKLGGLPVIYVGGFAILALNACLFYVLLRKVSTETVAIIGAVAFCLFPADTTHSMLTYSLEYHLSVTFLLAASLCFLSGRRALSYLVASGSLVTSESPFMVFLAVPLLRKKWDRMLAKETLQHAVVMAGIVLVVLAIRIYVGETRVQNASQDVPTVLKQIAAAMLIGPATSLALFVFAPVQTLAHWNWNLTGGAAAFLVAAICMLRRSVCHWGEKSRIQTAQAVPAELPVTDPIIDAWPNVGRLVFTGAAMLCLAYVTSFTHFPPTAMAGRGTSVHLAAALGGSLLFSCVGASFLSLAERFRSRNYAIALLSLCLSLMMAYRLSIQQDFVQAWRNQRSFWATAVQLAPDLQDGTMIFVLDRGLPKTRYVSSNSWADPLILKQLFTFPEHWRNPPRLFVEHWSWKLTLRRVGDHIEWFVPWPGYWEALPSGNVIVLEIGRGKAVRRFDPIHVDGVELKLKTMPDTIIDYEKGPLHRYLLSAS